MEINSLSGGCEPVRSRVLAIQSDPYLVTWVVPLGLPGGYRVFGWIRTNGLLLMYPVSRARGEAAGNQETRSPPKGQEAGLLPDLPEPLSRIPPQREAYGTIAPSYRHIPGPRPFERQGPAA